MKKILVTGAAGTIGVHVIKYLLSEGKYEITALDLRNKRVFNRLKRFKKRINIVYGDICDRVLIEALVKDHDIIIHLASSGLPLADMKKGLADIIDFNGTENIVRAINYYNANSFLFYASTTMLYKASENVTVKNKIELDEFDYYCQAKYRAEKLIQEKLKNYAIYRLPLILSAPRE
ncbi:MAG: NAD-dependent epimerase/dehydratase family protein, partial [Bacilli bacterium]|nr:NAD-dependent epimerase/dehydratase family protein [Bacilli bacterium]